MADVRVCYLANVKGEESIALCLASSASDADAIVQEIGTIFSRQFNASEHLDILFLNPDQEKEISRVCAAFYRQAVI